MFKKEGGSYMNMYVFISALMRDRRLAHVLQPPTPRPAETSGQAAWPARCSAAHMAGRSSHPRAAQALGEPGLAVAERDHSAGFFVLLKL